MKSFLLILNFICALPLFHAGAQEVVPSNRMATIQTVNLLRNLTKLCAKGYLLGHEDALAYGVNWKYAEGRSDVKEVTGDNPLTGKTALDPAYI